MSNSSQFPRTDSTPTGVAPSARWVTEADREADQLEQDVQMAYHALQMATKDLGQEQRNTVMKARLIGVKGALRAACQLATEMTQDDWQRMQARCLSAARYHYNRDAVDVAPQWKTKRRLRHED